MKWKVELEDGSMREVEADSEQEAMLLAEEPSFGQTLLQGAVVEAPTTYGGMADLIEPAIPFAENLARRTFHTPAGAPRIYPEEGRDLSGVARRAGKAALASIGRPYREPSGAKRYLQRAVGDLVANAPFAAIAGAGAGPFAALSRLQRGAAAGIELGSGVAAGQLAQGAEDIGIGPTGQAVAGLVGAAGVPTVANLGGALAREGTKILPGMSRLAAERDVQRLIAGNLTRGRPERLEEALGLLRGEEMRAGGAGPPHPMDVGRASSVQTLAPRFPEIVKLESSLGRELPDYQGAAMDLRERNLGELRAAVPRIVDPNARPGAISERIETEIERNRGEQAAAYQQAAELGATGATDPLHRELARQRGPREMGKALEREIPREPKRVIEERYTEEAIDPLTGEKTTRPSMEPVDELHNFRKLINIELERAAANPGSGTQVRNLMGLKRAVDDALNEAATSGDVAAEKVARLRDAIGLTAEQESVYAGHPAIEAFRKHVDRPEDALRKTIRAADQRAEAENLVVALRGDTEAIEGLKRAYVREMLLGSVEHADITEVEKWVGQTRSAQQRLAKSRAAGRVFLGEEGMRSFQRFLKRAETLSSGNVGAGKQAYTTQSGVTGAQALGAVRAPAQTLTMALVNKLVTRYQTSFGEILEASLIEPRLMRQLLETRITPSQFEQWAERFESTYQRTLGRPLIERSTAERAIGGARYPLRGIGASREEGEQLERER